MTVDVNYRALFEQSPDHYLVLATDAPRFTIVAASEAYLRATTTRGEEIIGRPLFDIFPDNRGDQTVTGMGILAESLQEVIRSGEVDRIPPQRYDIRTPGGDFEVRYWEQFNSPVFDEYGDVSYIIHRVEDVTERETRGDTQRFLAEAGMVLSSSLDYEATLDRVAHLAVPRIADWCTVDVLEEGAIHRLATAHVDPAQEEFAREFLQRNPPDLNAKAGVAQVLRTGEPELYPELPEWALREVARSEEDLQVLKEMGLRSAMVVPMTSHGRILGTITLITAESGRRFGPDDLDFARDLAGRAAIAVDNARAYEIAEEARWGAERWAREEATFRDLARAIAGAVDVDRVATQIAEAAIEMTRAFGAYIERIESRGSSAHVPAPRS